MELKLSRTQWEHIGKEAGWLKVANIPQATNPEVQKIAIAINSLLSRLMPNLQPKVSSLAGDLIRSFDAAFAQQAQFESGTNPNT